MMIAALILCAGVGSAVVYLRRGRWIDAALAVLAAAALGAMVAGFSLPADMARTVTIDPDDPHPLVNGAQAVRVSGDGLRAAQWHDLPARPLHWKAPDTPVLRLEFPRQLALGRMFSLTVKRSQGGPARLQLLAENQQVVAEANGAGAELSVQWLPPVAESLVLTARLLDGAGKVVAQGPVPLTVRAVQPLSVQGRFGAPSFDARILNDLLANSGALIDWQVTLGKTVTRSETARAPMPAPNLLVIDAAWFEHLHDSARSALMAQVAQGTPLIILAGNASEPALWARAIDLDLTARPENKNVGGPLALSEAPFNPAAAEPWTESGTRLWTRAWQKGRIVWLGVAEWHRFAISEPQALSLWWQGVLDQAGVRIDQDVVWQDPEEMPLPGRRLALCAQGVRGAAVFPSLKQTLAWQQRQDKADAACVAVWPREAGWLKVQAQGVKPQAGEVYVFEEKDWPMWQAAQRRDATARYAARTPVAASSSPAPLPGWPFGVLFAVAMLLLWWRERR